MQKITRTAFVLAALATAIAAPAIHAAASGDGATAQRASADPRSAPLTAIADSIQIRFQGVTELTGAYRLNEDETISVPGVGRISITGLTAADLERTLASRILGSTGRATPVSVEVSNYRHVFVAGYVEKPGSFQWQRGLTVVKAISISGGIYRRPTSDRMTTVDQNGALEIARLELAQALVDRARLEAELEDRKLITTPERLIGVVGAIRANEFVQSEQGVLENRRAALATRLDSLSDQKTMITFEIERLRMLAKSMEERTAKYSDLLSKMERSYRNGRLSNQRLFDVESQLANLQEKLASTNVQIVKAETARQALDSRRTELLSERREKTIEALSAISLKVKTAQIRYDTARDRDQDQAAGLSESIGNAQRPPDLVYEIIRQTSRGEQRVAADRFDRLVPGDTLVVTAANDSRAVGQPTRTARRVASPATR